VESVLGVEPISWTEVAGGYTPAKRWRVLLGDGSSAFVKSADGDEAWPIRREISLLTALSGDFFPGLLGSRSDPESATMILEDLSGWLWPPPYPDWVAGLYAMLDVVADQSPPAELQRLEKPSRLLWPEIASDPTAFLQMTGWSTGWFESAIGDLVEAERTFDPTGDDLVHNDIWAGNIAMSDRRCVLVDWAEAKIGSRFLDTGFLHLTLRSENGPQPTTSFSGEHAYVGWWSADLAVRLLNGPDPRLDPNITTGLRQDLQATLHWATEIFDLPPPSKQHGTDPPS
jgi:hypothetical protein